MFFFKNKLFLPVIVALLIDGWLHTGDLLLKKKMKKGLSLINSLMTESLNNITENTLPGIYLGTYLGTLGQEYFRNLKVYSTDIQFEI